MNKREAVLSLLDPNQKPAYVPAAFFLHFDPAFHGILSTGRPAEVEQAARSVLQDAPERFILGADCTVPATTPWDNLRTAIDTAHAFS